MPGNDIRFITEYEKQETNIEIISIDYLEINQFEKEFQKAKRLVKEYDNPLLTEQFAILYDFRTLILSSVIEYSHLLKGFDFDSLRILFSRLKNTFGKEINKSLKIISSFITQLIDSKIDNKCMSVIDEIIIVDKRIKVAIVHYNWADIEKEVMSKYENIELVTPNSLMENKKIYNQLIFLGTPKYYYSLANVFFSENIYYVSYSFFGNKFIQQTIVPDNNVSNNFIDLTIKIRMF